MEPIAYIIHDYLAPEDEEKNSTFYLVVNQEGNETISFSNNQMILHNCSIRSIVGESNSWVKYFDVYHDTKKHGIIVRPLKHQSFQLTKVRE